MSIDAIYPFLLKSIFVSGIFTAWYWLALRNKKLYHYNRFFLLLILYASIQVPLLHFQWFTLPAGNPAQLSGMSFVLHAINDSGPADTGVSIAPAAATVNWSSVIAIVVALVSCVLLAVLILRVMQVWLMTRQPGRTRIDGAVVIPTTRQGAPFSFLHYLFWNPSIPLDSPNGKLILQHELAHITQRHTFDKLISQLFTCICWFNPFYWIIQRELTMTHEFIADEKAIPPGDTETFATMMLQTHMPGRYLAPEHSFFSSPIKRRLTMLQNTNKTNYSLLRRLLALPLIVGAVLLFSWTVEHPAPAMPVKTAGKITLVMDAGHGGDDKGASYGGLTEKELNLKVAKRISELAPKYNIEVFQTRSGDDNVTLAGRVEMVNKLQPDGLISIHIADIPQHLTGKGSFDIFIANTNPRQQESKKLATAVYSAFIQRGGVQRGDAPVGNKGIYVLKHINVPGILIELGDIKHREQMEQLTNDAKLDELCIAILQGVVRTFRG